MNAVEQQAWIRAFKDEIERCKPWIEDALDNSAPSHYFEDIRVMLLNGDATLWSTQNGCVVTCFTTFPAGKMLQMWLMGGDFEEVYNERNASIEAFARENGCTTLFINGRKGWERRMKDRGYDFASVVLTKEL